MARGVSTVRGWLTVSVVGFVLVGCSSTPPAPESSDGFAYRDDRHLQKVWLAPGFRFQGYQTFLVEEPRMAVADVHPDGAENLRWARGVLRDQILAALRAKGLFPGVAMATPVPPETRALRLETSIIEYEKGGGGARFFGGVFGAGQPVIRVQGRVLDGSRLVFAFEARRSGETAKARALGGYLDDKEIQQEDIRDLAVDLVNYMARNGRPR